MTCQSVAPFVESQRDTAILAFQRASTASAKEKPGVAAPVYQYQSLRSILEPRRDSRAQFARDGCRTPRSTEVLAQIHHAHSSQRAILHSPPHSSSLYLPARALWNDSSEGVADPRQGDRRPPAATARIIAVSRP